MSLSRDNWPIPTDQEWRDYLKNQMERAQLGQKPESPTEAKLREQREYMAKYMEDNPLPEGMVDFYALFRGEGQP